MLKNISPLLNPDVLQVLAAMGHGDTLVLADANFPSESVAKNTTYGKVLRIDGANVTEAAPEVQSEVQTIVSQHEGEGFTLLPVERFAFYDKASSSYAVLATTERRFYGCFIFAKGVIPPEF